MPRDSANAFLIVKIFWSMGWCRLSGPMHLRLLTALCNDTLEGANMRAELAGRVDQISALQSERHQTQLEVHCCLS
jgi:hypothetical protein